MNTRSFYYFSSRLFVFALLAFILHNHCYAHDSAYNIDEKQDTNINEQQATLDFHKASELYTYIYRVSPQESFYRSELFKSYLDSLIRKYPQREFAWHDLQGLMYLRTSDYSVQILNWSIPTSRGTSSYAGLVWTKNTEEEFFFYNLKDYSSYMPYPEKMSLTENNWWGAYYYQSIENKVEDTIYLSLLGVNYSQPNYAQKIIEVLKVFPNGKIGFGAQVFDYPFIDLPINQKTNTDIQSSDNSTSLAPDYGLNLPKITYNTPQSTPDKDKNDKDKNDNNKNDNNKNDNNKNDNNKNDNNKNPNSNIYRVVFRYKKETDLILRYDFQSYRISNSKKAKLVQDYMIVFDRLIWNDISLSGSYSAYVPHGGLYDAYVFSNGFWNFKENVVARNANPSNNGGKKIKSKSFYTQ